MTAGESHGPAIVAILDGLPAGVPISKEGIDSELARRQQGYGAGPRMKIEKDQVELLSGLMEGVSNGGPIASLIRNLDHAKWRGKQVDPYTVPRPGHADLTGLIKYGFNDIRPALERASARETAARVAIGAICKQFLAQFNIQVGGYIIAIGDHRIDVSAIPVAERAVVAETNEIRCPVQSQVEPMRERIYQAIQSRDTLGGLIEVVVLGVPPGLGSYAHWDRKLDAKLGAAMLSVQAIKGVEIGPAFDNAWLAGTQVHDAIRLDGDKLIRPTNRAGGIEGGISNGEPIVIRAAMKPIATTLTPQQSVDLVKGEEVPTNYERSDFCPVPRAVPILEAMAAFVIADALLEKLGGDSLAEMIPRFENLRRTKLSDLKLVDSTHLFWPADHNNPKGGVNPE